MNNLLSYSSLKLDLFSKDGTRLKPASGFVVEAGASYYLITNWHVLSGREISASMRQESVIQPYTLKTSIHTYGGQGEKSDPPSRGVRQRITVQLYDDNDAPRWIERKSDEQYQPMVDVVALPIQLDTPLRSLFAWQSREGNINIKDMGYWVKTSAIPISAIDTDLEYGPPDTVHIIGYPLGWAPTGADKTSTAFWRTSSMASERYEIGRTPNVFFIDPCALEGMTGSPVVGLKNDRAKLLGVYSDSSTAEFGANAGLVWDALLLKELIGAS
jgi:hypothetical protein